MLNVSDLCPVIGTNTTDEDKNKKEQNYNGNTNKGVFKFCYDYI